LQTVSNIVRCRAHPMMDLAVAGSAGT
jgi:hypothetical protein